jgi:prepilin-type N-terminal cleavage/methylation domain-containing protein
MKVAVSQVMKANRLSRGTGAFTLTEVLMVTVILGILAALASPKVYRSTTGARVDEVAAIVARDLETAQTLAARFGRDLVVTETSPESYTIRDAAPPPDDTVRLRRFVQELSDGPAIELRFSSSAVRLFPTGSASGELKVTVTAGRAATSVVLRPEGTVEIH